MGLSQREREIIKDVAGRKLTEKDLKKCICIAHLGAIRFPPYLKILGRPDGAWSLFNKITLRELIDGGEWSAFTSNALLLFKERLVWAIPDYISEPNPKTYGIAFCEVNLKDIEDATYDSSEKLIMIKLKNARTYNDVINFSVDCANNQMMYTAPVSCASDVVIFRPEKKKQASEFVKKILSLIKKSKK